MEGRFSGQFTDRLETEKGFLQYFGEPYWSTHAILSGRLDLLCYREIWVIKVSILLSNSVFFQCSLRIGNRWLTSAKVASSSSLQHETTPKRHATTLHFHALLSAPVLPFDMMLAAPVWLYWLLEWGSVPPLLRTHLGSDISSLRDSFSSLHPPHPSTFAPQKCNHES